MHSQSTLRNTFWLATLLFLCLAAPRAVLAGDLLLAMADTSDYLLPENIGSIDDHALDNISGRGAEANKASKALNVAVILWDERNRGGGTSRYSSTSGAGNLQNSNLSVNGQ